MLARDGYESGDRDAGGAGLDDGLTDDCSEWDDCVPEGIHISGAERRRLHREHEKYLAELIEEVGEPTPEEMTQAEAWWRPIREHLQKSSRR